MLAVRAARFRTPAAVVVLAAGLFLGAAPVRPDDLVFPAGDQAARLAYVTQIRGNQRFAGDRSFLDKVADLLTGRTPPVPLIRPHGVAAGPDVLLVADAAAGWVHRYDLADSTWSRLPRKGRLQMPVDAAVAPDGTVVVADAEAGRVVGYSASGEERFCTAGDFVRPSGLAFDPVGGRFLIADPGAHCLQVLATDGRHLGRIGGRGQNAGSFNYPVDVCVMADGSLLVLDGLNFRIQHLDREGRPLGGFGEQGDRFGYLTRPRGIAVDVQGFIYVTDALQDVFQIFRADGQLMLAVGGQGREAGRFWMPAGVAVDPEGRIFVADAYNGRVQVFRLIEDQGGDGG